MPSDITDALTRQIDAVFNQRDPDRRAAAIAATYAPNLTFHDPDGTTTGRDAFAAKVQGLLDQLPGLTFSLRRPVQESAGLGLAHWAVGAPGQPPVSTGADIALVEDGLITTMWTVLD